MKMAILLLAQRLRGRGLSRCPRDILPTNRATASRRGERPRVAASMTSLRAS